jgi:ribosomal protein S18 acetylase RimI-like enzyme
MSNVSLLVRTHAATLTRRPACESDFAFLLDLRAQTIEPHFSAAGIVHSPAEQEARVRELFECAEILELDGQSIGLLKVLREPTHWRVMQVQLSPQHQGAGIGGHLIKSLMCEAGVAGVPITLSVLKVNPARRLYERLGFKVISEGARVLHMQSGG